MGDTLINIQRRRQSAADLGSVVRTMKAMATSNITQYEQAVHSLQDYYRTILLGLHASLKSGHIALAAKAQNNKSQFNLALIFGSDQGLVGRFNEHICTYAHKGLKDLSGDTELWAVGERSYSLLLDEGLKPSRLFSVPNSVSAITPLVNSILRRSEEYRHDKHSFRFFIFNNQPLPNEGYRQANQQLFPPDEKWEKEIQSINWPSGNLPQVIGNTENTFGALIREYLFVSLYKASAESLAAENASRLDAMQRAEKNIDEMLDDLNRNYNKLRQGNIDAELFDVIASFEALKTK